MTCEVRSYLAVWFILHAFLLDSPHKFSRFVPICSMLLAYIWCEVCIIAQNVWSLTEIWIVDAPENDKLVSILYQALQSPIQRLCTTLVGARCA